MEDEIESTKKKYKKIKLDVTKIETKKEAKSFGELIMQLAKEGFTMNMVLLLLDLRNSDWQKLFKKYKTIRLAVEDAIIFRKAYGEEMLHHMATGKREHSGHMAKLYMESFYDIKEARGAKTESDEEILGKIIDEYKVKTKMVKPEDEGTNDEK